MATATCRRCRVERERVLLRVRYDRHQQRGVYVDERGLQWHGRLCADCKLLSGKAIKERKRQRPTWRSPDEAGPLPWRSDEWLVCYWIKRHWGLECAPAKRWNGPDITLPNGETVEVKSVSRKGGYGTTEIRPARAADTWLAFVYDREDVVIIPMRDAVPPGGVRNGVGAARFDPKTATAERMLLATQGLKRCTTCLKVQQVYPPRVGRPRPGPGRPQIGQNVVDSEGRAWANHRCPTCTTELRVARSEGAA